MTSSALSSATDTGMSSLLVVADGAVVNAASHVVVPSVGVNDETGEPPSVTKSPAASLRAYDVNHVARVSFSVCSPVSFTSVGLSGVNGRYVCPFGSGSRCVKPSG